MHSTAVLVFANSSLEEMRHKPIKNGEALFNSLTKRTLKEVEKSTLPYFHITEEHQKGTTFGERFTNAIKSVFDKGFEKVITVGNDTPHLQSGHIKAAAEALIEGRTVLGPSLDGGFYLMGIHQANFDADDFIHLPWQNRSLLRTLIEKLEVNECSIFKLPVFEDIDTIYSIQRLSNYISTLPVLLLAVFSNCLNSIRNTVSYIGSSYNFLFLHLPLNKGSPVFVPIR
ncbi:DUF2064 domain-containing protein [Maribacter sp. 4G9]|uniref:TIGR04282 family arsenosugar biosynthesis glycosyltransferase n=1 Tax=Maribacter sp. 4G9 TaxID=1889777 RepID=UPI000C1571D1|nr:DUF2064 domain-containing protein [Maribacter sp. 4G9]